MASAGSLWRLHATKEPGGAAATENQKGQLSLLIRDLELPVRSRFVLTKPQPEAEYQLDSATMMNICEAADTIDRSRDFQALAAREKFFRLARHWLRGGQRGGAGSAAGPVPIQI
jgi:hypothetical protein